MSSAQVDRDCRFLRNPGEISSALEELSNTGPPMKIAVAFIRKHWRKMFENYTGKAQIVCWLNTTNTDPYAVEEMMNDGQFTVKAADSMHAKVYLAPGTGAVVGSANLSSRALTDQADIAGQFEAAVLITAAGVLKDIETWFDGLWQSAALVETEVLTRAKERFEARPQNGHHGVVSHPAKALPSVTTPVILPSPTSSATLQPTIPNPPRIWQRMFLWPSDAVLAEVRTKRERIYKKHGRWFDPTHGDDNHQNILNELSNGKERNFKTDFTDAARFGTGKVEDKLKYISRLGDAIGNFVVESSGDLVRFRKLRAGPSLRHSLSFTGN